MYKFGCWSPKGKQHLGALKVRCLVCRFSQELFHCGSLLFHYSQRILAMDRVVIRASISWRSSGSSFGGVGWCWMHRTGDGEAPNWTCTVGLWAVLFEPENEAPTEKTWKRVKKCTKFCGAAQVLQTNSVCDKAMEREMRNCERSGSWGLDLQGDADESHSNNVQLEHFSDPWSGSSKLWIAKQPNRRSIFFPNDG